jgi:peptidoglycan/LPS O-acetylase OafA/YrhL
MVKHKAPDMKREASQFGPHELASRSGNNFNVLRLMAASLVVLSHAFELPTGLSQHDWAFSVTGRSFAWYAVNLFFVISGYLIFLSWQRSPSAISFFWARFLRIMPGLVLMLLLTVSILGIAFSTVAFLNYTANDLTLRYLFGCLSIIFVKYELPGVFSSNPLNAVNGSLWTLRYEVFCYFSVAMAGLSGLLSFPHIRRNLLIAGILVSSCVLIWFDTTGLHQSDGKLNMTYELARLAMCFQLGGLYSEMEKKLPLKFIVVFGLVALMMAVARTPLFTPVANVTTAYAAIWFAFVPRGGWIAWTRSAPDYSYGIYIYAFPIQQALISSMPGISPLGTFVLGFCITLVFAALSWHLVERPALSYKRLRSGPSRAESANALAVPGLPGVPRPDSVPTKDY